MRRLEIPAALRLKPEKWQGVDVELLSGRVLQNLLVEDGRWIIGELVGGQDGVRDLDPALSSDQIVRVTLASAHDLGLAGKLREFFRRG